MKPIVDDNGKRWLVFSQDDDVDGFLCDKNKMKFFDYPSDFNDAYVSEQEVEYTEDHDYDEDEYDPDEYPYWEVDSGAAWRFIAIRERLDNHKYFDKLWNTVSENVKPLENNRGGDYNKGIGEKQMANTNIDVGSLMNIKMVEKLLDKDDFDLKDLMDYQMKINVMNGLANGQGVNINDIMRQKLMTKYMLNDKAEDMNFTQLAILNMLQSGRIDINQLVMVKMLEKLDK